MARLTSTVATRSPSQSHCISVVGTAHTLKLYGLMNMLAIPSPIERMIHSSKFAGLSVASVLASLASISPLRHSIWSSGSRALMLF